MLFLSPCIFWSGPMFALFRPYIFSVLALYHTLYFDMIRLAGLVFLKYFWDSVQVK